METGLTKNAVVAELTRSPHGKLDEYLPLGRRAVAEETDFFQHLVAWNARKGQIRDAKVALPVIGLIPRDPEYVENAVANLACLDPRNLVRAVKWARELNTKAMQDRKLNAMLGQYLFVRELNFAKWERAALQHRESMKSLYCLAHRKPSRAIYGEILFERKYPADSVFAVLGQLKNMKPLECAGEIITRKIPFLIALGALGKKQKDPDVLMALIERMSPTELVTNMKRLEKLGVKTVPALRAAMEQALGKAAKSGQSILKTSVAAEAVEDEGIAEKLKDLQEKQIEKAKSIEGNWAILADRSPSMQEAIEAAKHVAAALCKFVKGKVHLIFFDSAPLYVDVTGCTLDMIQKATKHIRTGSSTSIGCGVQYLIERKFDIDGIAVISDGAENTAPLFADRYKKFCEQSGSEPAIYFYRCKNSMPAGADVDLAMSCNRAGIEIQEFDLRGGVDFYSLTNLVQTMRASRYSLLDEIQATPLLRLSDIFSRREEEIHVG